MNTKRILPILSAFAIGMTALAGCQDSSSVAPATAPSDDGLFRTYALDDNAVDSYAALPDTYDEALNTLTPSSNPPGRDGGNHGSLTRANDIVRILRQLDLSDRQWAAIRGCFKDYNECVRSATARYRDAVQNEREELRSELARLKHAIENGDLTPEEARRIYRELLAEHRATAHDLKAALRAAIEHCRTALLDCIKGYLTDEQLVKWERLIGSGTGSGRG